MPKEDLVGEPSAAELHEAKRFITGFLGADLSVEVLFRQTSARVIRQLALQLDAEYNAPGANADMLMGAIRHLALVRPSLPAFQEGMTLEKANAAIKFLQDRFPFLLEETLRFWDWAYLVNWAEMVKASLPDAEVPKASPPEKASSSSSSSAPVPPPPKHKRYIEDMYGDDLRCDICKQPWQSPRSLECGHTFCVACLTKWLQLGHYRCAVCKTECEGNPNRHPENFVAKRFQSLFGAVSDSMSFYGSLELPPMVGVWEKRKKARSALVDWVPEADMEKLKAGIEPDSLTRYLAMVENSTRGITAGPRLWPIHCYQCKEETNGQLSCSTCGRIICNISPTHGEAHGFVCGIEGCGSALCNESACSASVPLIVKDQKGKEMPSAVGKTRICLACYEP